MRAFSRIRTPFDNSFWTNKHMPPWPRFRLLVVKLRDVYLQGLASYLFHQYYCLRVNRVYAEINTFLPPFSKRLFIAMIHRKV